MVLSDHGHARRCTRMVYVDEALRRAGLVHEPAARFRRLSKPYLLERAKKVALRASYELGREEEVYSVARRLPNRKALKYSSFSSDEYAFRCSTLANLRAQPAQRRRARPRHAGGTRKRSSASCESVVDPTTGQPVAEWVREREDVVAGARIDRYPAGPLQAARGLWRRLRPVRRALRAGCQPPAHLGRPPADRRVRIVGSGRPARVDRGVPRVPRRPAGSRCESCSRISSSGRAPALRPRSSRRAQLLAEAGHDVIDFAMASADNVASPHAVVLRAGAPLRRRSPVAAGHTRCRRVGLLAQRPARDPAADPRRAARRRPPAQRLPPADAVDRRRAGRSARPDRDDAARLQDRLPLLHALHGGRPCRRCVGRAPVARRSAQVHQGLCASRARSAPPRRSWRGRAGCTGGSTRSSRRAASSPSSRRARCRVSGCMSYRTSSRVLRNACPSRRGRAIAVRVLRRAPRRGEGRATAARGVRATGAADRHAW